MSVRVLDYKPGYGPDPIAIPIAALQPRCVYCNARLTTQEVVAFGTFGPDDHLPCGFLTKVVAGTVWEPFPAGYSCEGMGV